MACRADPAMVPVEAAIDAMGDAFTGDPDGCPPLVGNVAVVRFFAGDAPPMAAWDSHVSQGCSVPFVWVRAMRRYRSRTFPSSTIATDCSSDYLRVIAVEVGVAWCAAVDQQPRWEDYQREAEESMDVARRIDIALCKIASTLSNTDDGGHQVGIDETRPYGPEGGLQAWSGVFYATY